MSASFEVLEGDVTVGDLVVTGTLVPLPESSVALPLGEGPLGLLLLGAKRGRPRPSSAPSAATMRRG